MRIAHALQMPLLHQGGLEVIVKTLVDGCSAGDDVLLISADHENELSEVGCMGRLAGHLRVPSGVLPPNCSREILKWAAHQQVDLIHFHLPGTYGWEARSWGNCPITRVAESGVPVVCTNHSAVTFFDASRPPRPLWRKIAATLRCWPGKARQLRTVCWEACVSKHDLAVSRKSFPCFGDKLIQLYHSRLDADSPINTGPRDRTILNVATLAFIKGQHVLAEAFARIADDAPDWSLDLVGFKAEVACVEAIEVIRTRHRLQDRIRLHGPHPDPTPFYQTAGIYVQPSLHEGLGLSLQEAMFHGIPSIGSDCGGIPELLSDPSLGLLIKRGDVGSLAAALISLIADGESRRKLGFAARQSILASGMTRQAMCANYQKLYRQALCNT